MDTTPLRGRDADVRRLSQSIEAVAAGRGGVLLVEGAAGLGKSRLLQEAAKWAHRVGIDVARGGADELRRLLPLAPLLAAVHGTMQLIGDDQEPGTAYPLEYDRSRLIERITVTLRDRGPSRPILIILDDLQWADPSTLLAVQSITDLLAGSPVMWLLSRRPWPSTPPLNGLMANLIAGGATIIRLAPLSAGAVVAVTTDVLGAAPDKALLELLDKCDGNPFMVMELLRTLAEQDELVIDTGQARLLPGGTSGYVYQRLSGVLASVSPLTRQLLEVASIFGQFFDLRCVALVLRRTVAELLPPVHEALGSDLLVEDGAQLGFRTGLLREALYGALPLSARKTLHREAAEALFSVGSPVEAAAHLAKGGDVGDARAVALLVQASDEVAPGAPGTAADLRLRAVELMPLTELRRPQRVAEAVALLLRAGRSEEGEALAERSLQSALPAELEARLRFQLAETLGAGGHAAAALHQTRVALELQSIEDPVLAARADRPAAPRPAFGWESLTGAELRVARLAAGGLTNRLIADELSLSRHTVESHLRHAFRKLDLRSRVELARVVLTHEPTSDD